MHSDGHVQAMCEAQQVRTIPSSASLHGARRLTVAIGEHPMQREGGDLLEDARVGARGGHGLRVHQDEARGGGRQAGYLGRAHLSAGSASA